MAEIQHVHGVVKKQEVCPLYLHPDVARAQERGNFLRRVKHRQVAVLFCFCRRVAPCDLPHQRNQHGGVVAHAVHRGKAVPLGIQHLFQRAEFLHQAMGGFVGVLSRHRVIQ